MRKRGLQTLKQSYKRVSKSLSRMQSYTLRLRRPFKASSTNHKAPLRSSSYRRTSLDRRTINSSLRSWRRARLNLQDKKVWSKTLRGKWRRALKPSCKLATIRRRLLLCATRKLNSSLCNSKRPRTNLKNHRDSTIQWSKLWISNMKSPVTMEGQMLVSNCSRKSLMLHLRLNLPRSRKLKLKMMTWSRDSVIKNIIIS